MLFNCAEDTDVSSTLPRVPRPNLGATRACVCTVAVHSSAQFGGGKLFLGAGDIEGYLLLRDCRPPLSPRLFTQP